MADAIVMLLLNTGLRVDELVTLSWQRVNLQARSGWIDVVGKGDKHRRLQLNAGARKALEAIQSIPSEDDAVFLGKRGPGARDRVLGCRTRQTRKRYQRPPASF